MTTTQNLGIPLFESNENVTMDNFNSRLGNIDQAAASQQGLETCTNDLTDHKTDYTLQVPYGGTTTNVGNAYSIAAPAIASLTAGMAISVKVNADSTGAVTLNWNSKGDKAIYKANGVAVSNLKTGGIYTLRYDGTNFILQGEGASGNAVASDLLSGKTATVDAGEITGTMVNRSTGDYAADSSSVSGTTLKLSIPDDAFYGDSANITITDADWTDSNIRAGVNLLGKTGSYETPIAGIAATKTVKTGYSVSKGDRLIMNGGLVFPLDEIDINTFQFPKEFSVATGYQVQGDMCPMQDQWFLTLVRADNDSYPKVYPVQIEGDYITNIGSGLSVGDSAGSNAKICRLSDTKALSFIQSSEDLQVVALTLNTGTSSLSKGESTSIVPDTIKGSYLHLVGIDSTSALLIWLDSTTLKAAVATIDGSDNVTIGSIVTVATNCYSVSYISYPIRAFKFSDDKYIVAWSTSDNYRAQITVLPITNGVIGTKGNTVDIHWDRSRLFALTPISSSRAFLMYQRTFEAGAFYTRIISISGTTISLLTNEQVGYSTDDPDYLFFHINGMIYHIFNREDTFVIASVTVEDTTVTYDRKIIDRITNFMAACYIDGVRIATLHAEDSKPIIYIHKPLRADAIAMQDGAAEASISVIML